MSFLRHSLWAQSNHTVHLTVSKCPTWSSDKVSRFQNHKSSCGIMTLHVGSWCCMWDHEAACGIMKLHVGSWCCMWDHDAACAIMKLHVRSWCCRWDHEAACGIMILHVGSNHSDCCRVPTWVRSHWRSNLRNIISWKQHIFKHFLLYTVMTIGLFIFFNTSNVDDHEIILFLAAGGIMNTAASDIARAKSRRRW